MNSIKIKKKDYNKLKHILIHYCGGIQMALIPYTPPVRSMRINYSKKVNGLFTYTRCYVNYRE
jgi:hypothetical protein